MKKFNEWMEDRPKIINESPFADATNHGRFLGQIMGWDSHGDPNTLRGKFANWRAGGKHRKAQEMGSYIYNTISNPSSITDIINRAIKDGVYDKSTFKVCYDITKKMSAQYRGSATSPGLLDLNTPQFQSMLLHEILGKCHSSMSLNYVNAENFYHNVMGTNPAAKATLSTAYDKDPKNLKDWLEEAKSSSMPHPEYSPTNYKNRYWLISSQGMISPLNLIRALVDESPSLSLPKNSRELQSYSIDFAEAYFPHIINKRKAANSFSSNNVGGNEKSDLNSMTPQERYGDDLDAMVNVINHFAKNHGVDMTKGDNSVSSGKKKDLMTALSQIMGPSGAAAAAANADSNTLLKVLADHKNFFGMQQLIEQKKLD